jgi:hypothetical protein
MNKRLTKADKLLLSALKLEEQGERPFSAEQLVVEAWRQFEDAFALQGYPQYPDSNRVYSLIMGSKPLRNRGWLRKVGTKMYQLSEAGLIAARNLQDKPDSGQTSRSSLDRKQRTFLDRLISSAAVQKVSEENPEDIVFSDACAFWQISPRSNAKTFHSRVKSVESVLDAAEQVIASSNNIVMVHGDEGISLKTIALLRETHAFMLKKFEPETKIIQARTDERSHS